MDIVLGVSMAPSAVQIVLLQGENADGATVDENEFAVAGDDSPTVSASDRVIAAIVGTRDDPNSAGFELSSVGVACTDQLEAAALRDALTAHKIENVMLVSTFMAATALAQSLGGAMGYDRTAVLFVEPDAAKLAVVEAPDGSMDDVHTEELHSVPGQTDCAKLIEMVAGLDDLESRPGGLFVVGRGVDVATIKRNLEEATSLAVSAPEEPETALARGAALASAYALASPIAALAYAQDPGTGVVDAAALPEYLAVDDAGDDDVAYSAVEDDEAGAPTVVIADDLAESAFRRRPKLLVGTVIAVAGFSAALALEIALTVGVHTTVGLLPAPLHNFLAPAEQLLAPVPQQVAAAPAAAPKPLSAPAVTPVPAAQLSAVLAPAAPAVPVPAAPAPQVLAPLAPAAAPSVQLPNAPASPPVVQAPPPSAPVQPPPIYVPPPHSPPSHLTPPDQGPGTNPGSPGGGGPVNGPGHWNPGSVPHPGHPGNPGDGGPVNGPGPDHGNPGAGGPHEGGSATGAEPGHGIPGGTPPDVSGPVGGGETPGSSGPAGGGAETGGGNTSGGTEAGGSDTGSAGADTGGSTVTGGSDTGGAETGGSSSSDG